MSVLILRVSIAAVKKITGLPRAGSLVDDRLGPDTARMGSVRCSGRGLRDPVPQAATRTIRNLIASSFRILRSVTDPFLSAGRLTWAERTSGCKRACRPEDKKEERKGRKKRKKEKKEKQEVWDWS